MHAPLRTPNAEPIDPLVHNDFHVPGSALRFSVSCFGGSDWSMRNIYDPQDRYRYPDFTLRLANAFSGVGAKDVYAPTPTKFNGAIALKSDLKTRIDLPFNVSLYRNPDFYADGCFLSARGEAGAFSAGGCGVVVAAYQNDLIFAHAGRESILDRHRVLTRGAKQSRQWDLADHILISIGAKDMHKLHLWPLYFIGPDEFVHRKDAANPDHAEYNRAAMEYLPRKFPDEFGWVNDHGIGIDLARIFRAQCVTRGVPAENVHLEHADLHKELPTTRNGGKNGRYLVAGVRHTSPR